MGLIIAALICTVFLVLRGLHQIREDERGVVQRFGAFRRTEKPGLRFILPGIERVTRISAKTFIFTDQCQGNCRTQDNMKITVRYLIRLRAVDAAKALLKVDDWWQASLAEADAVIRREIATRSVKDILADWPQLGAHLSADLSEVTCIWGVLAEVEIVDVVPIEQVGMGRTAHHIA